VDSNITQTHNQVSNLLGLSVTSTESKFLLKANVSEINLRESQQTPAFWERRSFAKMTKDHLMGKVDVKKVRKSGKVPLAESAKCNLNLTFAISRDKVRKPRIYSIYL
jgi:hypothetical protein